MATGNNPLPSILNFRDVAELINAVSEVDSLRTRQLYRSARPDDASADDRQQLKDAFGVRTIVDLRSETEHIENDRKRDARIKASVAAGLESSFAQGPVKIPGIRYHNINFNGKNYTNSLLKQLSWPQYFKLIGLVLAGYRVQGVRVLGENVMKQRGLVGLGVDSVDACTKEVKQVFDVLADETNYPILIHCTQGKDRTGLVVILALLVCGVKLDVIDTDYMLSEFQLEPEKAQRLKEIESIGLTEEFAGCDPEFVKAVHQHILHSYGSVGEYLSAACGVTEAMQGQVRRILLQKRDASST